MVPALGRAALVAAVVALSGCTAWPQRLSADFEQARLRAATERPVACGAGPFPSDPLPSDRVTTVNIGSVAFRGLGYPYSSARFQRGAPPVISRVVVPPRSRAIVSVPPQLRLVAGLDGYPTLVANPLRAHRAVLCETGPERTVFRIAFVVAGARCVPVSVTIDRVTTTRDVPFGISHCPS
jgi:hypothetical protein